MTGRSRPTRGPPSRIQQLPLEIKAKLDELLRAGVTQTQILTQLAPLLEACGERPLSYSSLNRYATRMESVGRRIREMRDKVQELALSVQRIERASHLNASRERAMRKEMAEIPP